MLSSSAPQLLSPMAMKLTVLLALGAQALSSSAPQPLSPLSPQSSQLLSSPAPRILSPSAPQPLSPSVPRLSLRGGSGLLGCFGSGVLDPEEPMVTEEVAGAPEIEGEGKPRRNIRFPELVATPFAEHPEVDTPFAAFEFAAKRFPERNFLGHREILADGKRGGYVWESYGKTFKDATALGEGLSKVCGLGRGQKAGIYSVNRPQWTMSMLGLWSQGIINVPLYDSVGTDAVRYIINHAALPVVLVERSKLATLLEATKEIKHLKHIVLFEDVEESDLTHLRKEVKLHSLSDIIKAGTEDPKPQPQKPEELATILYTSGTTGDPKGVMLTAKAQLASGAGCLLTDETYDGKNPETSEYFNGATYISYLPLAHSFELNMQILMITTGSEIGFYSGDVRNLVTGDAPALKPTIFPGVPRVYSRIHDKILAGLEAKGKVTKTLFDWGYKANLKAMKAGGRSYFWDKILFSKLQALLGGRVKLFLSGAAPLGTPLHTFLKCVFGAPVVQGYGMTENAGSAMCMPPDSQTVGTVGTPIPCTEVKLVDIPEMEYTTQDLYPKTKEEFEQQVTFKGAFNPKIAGKNLPRGEICLRGANIMNGYFKLESETSAVLSSDGWVRTGDVGQWNLDGSLSIIDRKKNIFKLSQGEYVAVETVENVVSQSKFVLQCWVYGNSLEPSLVAVVVPEQEQLTSHCKKLDLAAGDLSGLCALEEIQSLIFNDIKECCKSANLRGYEHPKAIYIETNNLNDLGQGFTVDNGCLTPTFKLKRPQLLKKYSHKIDIMYKKLSGV